MWNYPPTFQPPQPSIPDSQFFFPHQPCQPCLPQQNSLLIFMRNAQQYPNSQNHPESMAHSSNYSLPSHLQSQFFSNESETHRQANNVIFPLSPPSLQTYIPQTTTATATATATAVISSSPSPSLSMTNPFKIPTFPTAIPVSLSPDTSSLSSPTISENNVNTNLKQQHKNCSSQSQQSTQFQLETWNGNTWIRDLKGSLIFRTAYIREHRNHVNFIHAMTGDIVGHVEYKKKSFGSLEYKLFVGDTHYATLKQKWTLIAPKFKVEIVNRFLDGADLIISGEPTKHDFIIFRGEHQEVARVTKHVNHHKNNDLSKIEILPGEDVLLLLQIAVIIDRMCHNGWGLFPIF